MAKRMMKSVSLAAAVTLLLTSLAPVAFAAPADDAVAPAIELNDVASHSAFGALNRLPLVEPGVIGKVRTERTTMPVKGLEDGSALIRLTAFAADQEVVVSTTGAPVLRASRSEASTTVLVPVQGGRIPISATSGADVRVEILASFGKNAKTPGSTIALQDSVKRADSANGFGLNSLSSEEQAVSVVGIGGVPSENVRAVYTTATVQLEKPGTVTLSGQQLQLPAGQSIVTTVATVDEQGALQASANVSGDIRLDISGWVVGASQNMSSANVTGSYVPTVATEWQHVGVTQESAKPVAVEGYVGRQQTLALVSAAPSEVEARAFVNVGAEASGRSRGVLVDPEHGALPQIELVETTTETAPVSVRGADAHVGLLPLGDIVGNTSDASGALELNMQAPADVDLGLEGEIVLSGSISSDAPVDKVELYGNGTFIGTASVRYLSNGATWTFRTAAPTSGLAGFKANAIARDGSTASAEAEVNVTLPAEDVTVVDPDTVVLDTKTVGSYDNGEFILNQAPDFGPGAVLVAGVSEQTPEGALREVVSIQQTSAGWKVETKQAALTDVFLQAHNESSMPAFTQGTEIIAPTDNQGFEVVDDGLQNVQLVVDEGVAAPASARRSRESSVAPAAEVGHNAGMKLEAEIEYAFMKETKKDLSLANSTSRAKAKREVKAEGGLSFSANFEASLNLETALGIDIRWNWGIPTPELTDFKSVFKGGLEAGYEAAVSGKWEATIDYEIAKVKAPGLTVLIGPVPVVFVPGASLSAVGGLEAEISIAYGDGINPEFEYGVEYKDRVWSPVNGQEQGEAEEPKQCVGWGSKITSSGSVSGQAGLELTGDVKIFGIAGPAASISAKGETGFEVKYGGEDDKIEASLTRGLVIGADLAVDAEIEVLGFKIGDKWTMLGIERKFEVSNDGSLQLDVCPNEEGPSNPDEEEPAMSTLSGSVTDAATNEPISGAIISITDGNGDKHSEISAANGTYSLDLAYGRVAVSAKADGYIGYSRTVNVAEGVKQTHDVQMSRELASTQYRAVVTWGENPTDLDSHLVGVSEQGSYHVYYGNDRAYDENSEKRIAELDVDDVTSYGPETTTFDVSPSGSYSFFVHNYSGSPSLAGSDAHVTLYHGDAKVGDYDVPAGGDELYWNVFQIHNGQLKVLNDLSDSPLADDGLARMARSVDSFRIDPSLSAKVRRETEARDK